MNANVLAVVSYVAFVCSFLFLMFAIILFIKLDIKSIISDLSGKKAQKQIQEFRKQNANHQKNINTILGRTGRSEQVSTSTGQNTEKLNVSHTMEDSEETELLYSGTMLLEEEKSCLDNRLILDVMVIHTGDKI